MLQVGMAEVVGSVWKDSGRLERLPKTRSYKNRGGLEEITGLEGIESRVSGDRSCCEKRGQRDGAGAVAVDFDHCERSFKDVQSRRLLPKDRRCTDFRQGTKRTSNILQSLEEEHLRSVSVSSSLIPLCALSLALTSLSYAPQIPPSASLTFSPICTPEASGKPPPGEGTNEREIRFAPKRGWVNAG